MVENLLEFMSKGLAEIRASEWATGDQRLKNLNSDSRREARRLDLRETVGLLVEGHMNMLEQRMALSYSKTGTIPNISLVWSS